MPDRSTAFAWAALLSLGACAGLGQPPPPPYYNLNKLSYGPLATQVPESCNPQAQGGGAGVAELSRQITALIMKPLGDVSQVDPEIKEEGLTDKFKIVGDPGGYPVVILHRGDDGILFWHLGDLVTVPETQAAAEAFCERRGRKAVWEGSARQCGTPQPLALAINHEQVVIHQTYVLSSYMCVAPDSGRPSSRTRRGSPSS